MNAAEQAYEQWVDVGDNRYGSVHKAAFLAGYSRAMGWKQENYLEHLPAQTGRSCSSCEYNKQRAMIWRDAAYKNAGHPLPAREPFGYYNSQTGEFKQHQHMHRIGATVWPLYLGTEEVENG